MRLEFIILVITFVIALISLKEKTSKFWRITLIVFLFVGSSFSGMKIYYDHIAEKQNNIRAEETSKNVKNLGEDTKEIIDKVSFVEKETLLALAKRESIIVEYNQVTEQLKKQNEFEKLDLQSKGPILTVLGQDMKFINIDSISCDLQMRFINMGTRPAINFNNKVLYIVYDKLKKSFAHIVTEEGNSKSVYSFSGTDKHFFSFSIYGLNREFNDSEDYEIFVFININYIDEMFDTYKVDHKNFIWNQRKKVFSIYHREYINELEEYFKLHSLSDDFKIRL